MINGSSWCFLVVDNKAVRDARSAYSHDAKNLVAFPDNLTAIVLFTRQCVPSEGSSVRRGRFEATFVAIGWVFHAVKGVDDGLLLLMIERVGLAEHHILEYLRLGFGDEGKVGRLR